jgi:hypothetical protein
MVLENGRFSKTCQKAVLEDGEVKLHQNVLKIPTYIG